MLTDPTLRLLNLTENAAGHFQGSLFGCFENAPYTALSIVYSINVSIDCKKNKISDLLWEKNILNYKSRHQVAWFVYVFNKIFVCKDDDFSVFRAI